MVSPELFENPIIDLRSEQAFAAKHLIDSSSFPVEYLEQRMHELPIKSLPLSVVGNEVQIKQAEVFLQSKGYQIAFKQMTVLDQFSERISDDLLADGDVSKRLWQPSDVVARFCQDFYSSQTNKQGLDLACGAGRDSLYLTEKGWQMTSVDFSPSALDKLQNSAKRAKQNIACLELNIEKDFGQLLEQKTQYDLVLVVRYLHRPLLETLKSLIKPSGFIVYQTFMQGCEEFGSPKNPRYLLAKDELASVYSDFDILYDEVTLLNDGRPTNSFIAQKCAN